MSKTLITNKAGGEMNAGDLLEVFDLIKAEQYRFEIIGEDGYDRGYYRILIHDFFGEPVVKIEYLYKWDDGHTLLSVMREAITEFCKLRPDFIKRSGFMRDK